MKPATLATALIALSEQKTPKKAVAALAKMLDAKGKGKLLFAVKQAVIRAGQKKGTGSRIVVARKEDATHAHTKTKDKEARIIIDETIVGGYRHITANTLTDASHKAHLETLFTRITQ